VSGQPVRARLEVFEVSDFDTIRTSQWTDEDGLISVSLRSKTSYGVMAIADDYLMYSVNLDPDTSALRTLDIKLIPLTSSVDKVIVLQNVFFETGSAALLSTSEPELNKLLWTLRKNTAMKMEVRGHTDNVGDEKANQKLSEGRAKTVYDYLTGRGIETTRLSYTGFGETQPIADNANAEGRILNRRTEFKIISN
jgi:outer membrane protein OmpA-like peptidoglycan-associated protein